MFHIHNELFHRNESCTFACNDQLFIQMRDNTTSCTLCLGSNYNGLKHLKQAENELNSLFPGMEWGEILQTEPENMPNSSPFFNRAARLKTSLNKEQLIGILKQIEQIHGRNSEKKEMGIIPLDIDLLFYGKETVKSDDINKHYVKECLNTLPQEIP